MHAARAWWVEAWDELGSTGPERLLRFMTGVFLLVGLWLRGRGYLYRPFPLWLDEADWAVRLFERPLMEHLIRPPGFMALAKVVTSVFSRSEAGLRFVPWAAGIGAVLLSPALARRLFKSPAAQLVCIGVIAFQPAAIDLGKEFKPYSLGFLLHLALLYLVLSYVATGKTKDLIRLCVVALPAVLFTQDVVFAYPAVFLVAAYEAFRARRTRHLISIVLVGAASFALVIALYLLIWRRMDMKVDSVYWGNRYGIFYVPGVRGAGTRAAWFYHQYFDIADLPALRASTWSAATEIPKQTSLKLAGAFYYLWSALHVIGLFTIVIRRRFKEGFLLFAPLCILAIANYLGYFPMASFRADFFLLAYIAPIAAYAFERSKGDTRWLDVLPATLLVILPLLVFERDWHARKAFFAGWSEYPRVFERLLSMQDPARSSTTETLALDERSCIGWRYYIKYHPTFSKRVGAPLLHHLVPICFEDDDDERHIILSMYRTLLRDERPDANGWFLVTKDDASSRWASRVVPPELQIVQKWSMRGKHFIFETARKPKPPASDPE